MTLRVLLAVVDQLCADTDADLSLLESLAIPLEDSVDALTPREIDAASVTLHDDVLVVDFHLRRGDGLLDTAPFGETSEVVESFFDVHVSDDPPLVRLAVNLA